MRRVVLLVLVLVTGVLVLDVPMASAAPVGYTQTTVGGDDLIYEVDLATGQSTLVGDSGLEPATVALTFGADGVLYGVNNNRLVSIDTATGAATVIGDTPSAYQAMAVADADSLWGIGANPSKLWRIDTATGAATDLGPLNSGLLVGLAADCSTGDVYAGDAVVTDGLLSVDVSVPSTSAIGGFGIPMTGSPISFDSTGTMWMLGRTTAEPSVMRTYTVDTDTGAITQVAPIVNLPNTANALALQGPACPEPPGPTTTTGGATAATPRPSTVTPASSPASAVVRSPAFTG